MDDNRLDDLLQSGFEQLPPRKLPSDLWTRISGALPEETEEKADGVDEAVKQAFTQQPQKSVPTSMWSRIEEQLNEQPLDSAIKTALEQAPQRKAPAQLWKNIEQQLDRQPLDQAVRSSFDQTLRNAAPERIWYAVSKQLTIDKAWTFIAAELEGWRIAAARRRRLRITGIAAALALLLWWKGCDTGLPTLPASVVERQPISTEKTDVSNTSTPNLSVISTETTPSLIITETKSAQPETILPIRSSKKQKTVKSFQRNGATLVQEPRIDGYDELPAPVVNGINTATNVAIEQDLSTERTACYDWLELRAMVADGLPPRAEEYVLEPISLPSTKGSKWSKLELGLACEVGTQVLLNSETRASLRVTSLSKTKFLPATSIGVALQWNFTRRSAIQLTFLPKASLRQQYFTYQQGNYIEKTIRMDYVKWALSYQYHFAASPYGEGFARAGIYAAHLLQRQELYEHLKGNWSMDNTQLYRRWDGGGRIAAGYRYTRSHWVVEAGLQAEMGFGNIFAGTLKVPAYFRRTHVFGLSAFVHAKYRF